MLFGFNIFIQITNPRFSWFIEGKNYKEVVLELNLDATACPYKSYSMCWVLAAVTRENLQLFATGPTERKEHMDWVCAPSERKQAAGFNAFLLSCCSTARWAASCTCRNLRLLGGVGGQRLPCVSASRAVAFPSPPLWTWLHWIASLCEGRIGTAVQEHVFSMDCLENHIFTYILMW